MTRSVRWKIDQELAKRNIDPLFKENYRAYDKEEFLIDADIEFFRIKTLLEKNPKILKDDPLLGIDYLKIINLIKKKKLVELSSDQYLPSDSINSTFLDVSYSYTDKVQRLREDEERLRRD